MDKRGATKMENRTKPKTQPKNLLVCLQIAIWNAL